MLENNFCLDFCGAAQRAIFLEIILDIIVVEQLLRRDVLTQFCVIIFLEQLAGEMLKHNF